jgi:hypothetical protein
VGEAEVAEKGKQCRRRRSIVKYTTYLPPLKVSSSRLPKVGVAIYYKSTAIFGISLVF